MKQYFCGWYFKCQNDTQTAALIPAYHIADGEKSCSLQVITGDGSWTLRFPFCAFKREKQAVEIAGSRFGADGIRLDLRSDSLRAEGAVRFGPFTALRYDIMGPFRYVPFLECRHSVYSMGHTVNGQIEINGVPFSFENGVGYLEGDRGRSFPKEYVWTQGSFPGGSVMLSAADIPLAGVHFTGVIGVICWQGRQYRLGTYWGARAVRICGGEVVVRQGCRQLTVRRLEQRGRPLAAPAGGSMCRTIHEAASCRVYFRFQEAGRTVFERISDRASFEYEYPQ